MDVNQLMIMGIILLVVVVIISYFIYQEIRFKKIVDDSFNKSHPDVIKENKTIVLKGIDSNIQDDSLANPEGLLQKDIYTNQITHQKSILHEQMEPLREKAKLDKEEDYFTQNSEESARINLDELPPEDSREAFFVKLDRLLSTQNLKFSPDTCLIIDMVFEEPVKLKILPDIEQYVRQEYKAYILDENHEWQTFMKGKKATVLAIKLVLDLIEGDNLMSEVQISNIYSELHKFILKHHGHIRLSNYEESLREIQRVLHVLPQLELTLKLLMAFKQKVDFATLSNDLKELNLTNCEGKFAYFKNNNLIFWLTDEEGKAFDTNNSYNLIRVNCNLHLMEDPHESVELILDFIEDFSNKNEARLLTLNKEVFTQIDYDNLMRHLDNYLLKASRAKIKLGSNIIKKIYGESIF